MDALLESFVKDAMKPSKHILDSDFRIKTFKTDNWSFRWSISAATVRKFMVGYEMLAMPQRESAVEKLLALSDTHYKHESH